jgi:hypothetical protein
MRSKLAPNKSEKKSFAFANKPNSVSSLSGDFPSLAMGIRSMNDEETGVGITYDSAIPSSSAKGAGTTASSEVMTSYEELAQKSDLSIDMNMELYGFKGGNTASFFKSFHYNAKSQYLFAEIAIETPSREIVGYKFSDEAKRIAEGDINKFYHLYGDEFVYKELRGASLKLIFEFRSTSSEEEESNSASMSVTEKFFAGNCSTNAKYSTEYKNIEQSTNIKVYINREGNYDEMPDFTFEGASEQFRKFPTTVNPTTGGYDVVTGVKRLSYKYAANKPNNIDQLGVITNEANNFVEALNARLCKLYESLGNINYIKQSKSDYPQNVVDSLLAMEPIVNKQIEETIDTYKTFKSTYQAKYTADQVKAMPIAIVGVPEIYADDFLPDYKFGENALDNKIYLGKVVTSHNTPLKIVGDINFLQRPQPENVFSFEPVFHDTWLAELQGRVPNGLRLADLGSYISPRLTPIHIYLNDSYSNFQVKEYVYDGANSILIPPGRYYLYVMIDPYGRLLKPNVGPTVSNWGGDLLVVKKPVISLPKDELLQISFRN